MSPDRQPPPVRGVQASGRIILLRTGALVGCILGTSLACSGAQLEVAGMVGTGCVLLAGGLVCWVAGRVMQA